MSSADLKRDVLDQQVRAVETGSGKIAPRGALIGHHSGIQFSVLGPVRLDKHGLEETAGQPRQCAVLASLLLRAGKPVSLARLVEDVWGDEAPPSAVGSVRTYVYRLRRALGDGSDSSLSLVDGGYRLRIQPDALDLNRFKERTARAREARGAG
ncbi:AfsR/SARP family transcriptional regulator, partial [Streptomyces sp. NPDC003333]